MGVRIPEDNGDEELLRSQRATSLRAIASRPGCYPIISAPPTCEFSVTLTSRSLERYTAPVRLPAETFILDQYGLARALSLPVDADGVA